MPFFPLGRRIRRILFSGTLGTTAQSCYLLSQTGCRCNHDQLQQIKGVCEGADDQF